ncbi:hypothetical protein [Methylobacterium sp. Leaf102]|uniref:hypothetical protein n=1 Tax=Methylobacterium sp. Leaf102 TaxID=1736253 RepID=UPI00138F7200|nr:hypothetical protein [Methylobacterium sp. Leaf102]
MTLIDRQPLQQVQNHVICQVEDFAALTEFRTAIVDSPWYPKQLRDWSCVAGRAVGVGGAVFVSAWPEHTRPQASHELASVLCEISSWADIYRNIEALGYAEPAFEAAAHGHGLTGHLSRSPLVGELIRLDVKRLPHQVDRSKIRKNWLRFTADDYQLALRLDTATASTPIEFVDGVDGWKWPYVSARAPFREQIGLWSSAGEVASIGAPSVIAATLRSAFLSRDSSDFETALAELPELLSWRIPRPPYRRWMEWQHRQ